MQDNTGPNYGFEIDADELSDRMVEELEEHVDHEQNCAACGVNRRAEGSKYCATCKEELQR